MPDERYYDTLGDQFGEWMNDFDVAERLRWFDEQLSEHAPEPATVLDVGCGLGHFSRLAARRGHRVISLDIARGVLSRGDLDAPVNASALRLPFADASLPIAISSECIEHTPDPMFAVRELVRVLRPGGLLVLSCPNRNWRWSLPLAQRLGVRKYAGIENWPARGALRRQLREAGAEVLVDGGLHLLPFQLRPLHRLAAWLNRHGQPLRALMINQCWVARRQGSSSSSGSPGSSGRIA